MTTLRNNISLWVCSEIMSFFCITCNDQTQILGVHISANHIEGFSFSRWLHSTPCNQQGPQSDTTNNAMKFLPLPGHPTTLIQKSLVLRCPETRNCIGPLVMPLCMQQETETSSASTALADGCLHCNHAYIHEKNRIPSWEILRHRGLGVDFGRAERPYLTKWPRRYITPLISSKRVLVILPLLR